MNWNLATILSGISCIHPVLHCSFIFTAKCSGLLGIIALHHAAKHGAHSYEVECLLDQAKNNSTESISVLHDGLMDCNGHQAGNFKPRRCSAINLQSIAVLRSF